MGGGGIGQVSSTEHSAKVSCEESSSLSVPFNKYRTKGPLHGQTLGWAQILAWAFRDQHGKGREDSHNEGLTDRSATRDCRLMEDTARLEN